MKKKCAAVLLTIVIFAASAIPAGADTIDSVKQQRARTQGSLDQLSEQIEGLESEREEVNEELDEMNTELVDILTSIAVCQSEIEIKEKEIEEAGVKLTAAQEDEKNQYQSMKKRVQFLYERGEKAYVQALIESSGYSDLVNKADYVEKLYSYDHELLEKYMQVRQEVSDLKNLLEEEEADLEAARYELGQEQASLELMIAEKKKTVENFDQKLAEARATASAMQEQLVKQTAQIKALEEAKRKQKEAELKKQQEEAAKLAAKSKKKSEKSESTETGKKQDKTKDTVTTIDGETGSKKTVSEEDENETVLPDDDDDDDSGNSGNSDDGGLTIMDDDYDEPVDDYVTTNEEFSAGAGAATVESSGSTAGQKVIDYACQFVGNPYKFGGTSLTEGTDCSGFTQSIYSHFGVSLPRDSTSQRSAGTEVSYSEAQPGDIVCYAGHVALYMGNGMIVHASTERTGITYSPASYRTILSIRRVL